MDYTTQGDPNQVAPTTPLNMFTSTMAKNYFHGTNNFFIPDGSNRRIHDIHDKIFHAGYLENGNNAYILELPGLEKMLHTWKFLMDEMSGYSMLCMATATSECPQSLCYNKHGKQESSSIN